MKPFWPGRWMKRQRNFAFIIPHDQFDPHAAKKLQAALDQFKDARPAELDRGLQQPVPFVDDD